jgi:competence protein ComEC
MDASVIIRKAIKSLLREPTFFTERPLIPFLASFAGGIILGDRTSLPWIVPALLLLMPLTGFLFALRRNKTTPALILIYLCAFLTGLFCMAPYTTPGPPIIVPSADGLRGKTVFRGFIEEPPQISPDRIAYILSGVQTQEASREKPIPGRVLLSAKGPDVFRYGDYVQFRVRLTPPRNFNNPGGFDYRKYLRRQEIFYRATISEQPDLILIRRGQGNPLKAGIESYRALLRDFITRHTTSPEREIILGMMLGEQKAISDDLKERFNQTGTSHIIAISGFNVGLIAFFSVLFFQSVMKIFPRLLLRWNVTKVSYTLSLIPILLYTGIAGMGISVVRATLMVVVLMTAILIRKPKDLFNALALAAIIILALSPPSVFDPSFQLSFAAVAAILFIPPKFQHLFPDQKEDGDSFLRPQIRKWGRTFYLFLLVSISATLGTLPIIAYHFHRLSTVVIPANIAVIPFLGILTTPLCLLMIITYPFSETLCLILVQCAVYLIQISVFFVNFFSSLPGSSLLVPPPGWIGILLYYVTLSALTQFSASRIKSPSRESELKKPISHPAVGIGLLFLIPALAGVIIYIYLSAVPSKFLKLTVIDVGQGSCALLQIPGNKTILIDGGGFEGGTFDVGRYVVAPFLLREKVRKIDVVVLTHPHPDHLNGLVYILKNFPVGEVWTNGESAPYESYLSFRQIINEKRLVHRVLYQGQPDRRINNLQVCILNPPLRTAEYPERSEDYTAVNDKSLVLYLRFGQVRILLPGDIARDTEERLASMPDNPKSDIILAPHHGGRTSSTETFLDKVSPDIAIISCGLDNRYKDPHPDVIKRYENIGTKIFRTDRDGAVQLLTDGTHIFDTEGKRLVP